MRRRVWATTSRLVGRPCCLIYATLDQEGHASQAFRTLFLQETIRRGMLMPSLVVSYTHDDADIDRHGRGHRRGARCLCQRA